MATVFHKILFIRPNDNANLQELAQQLIGMAQVQEVSVTDARNGFLAKTRFFLGREPKNIRKYFADRLGTRYGEIMVITA